MAQAAYDPSAASAVRLDETTLRILEELQKDGRLSATELGRRVSLSPPAVTERLRRLEQSGLIEGYTARVNPKMLGLSLCAFVRLSLPTNMRHEKAKETLGAFPEIVEAHHITGEDCFLLKVVARDAEHLEDFISQISGLGRTTTSIVLSSPVGARPIVPPPPH